MRVLDGFWTDAPMERGCVLAFGKFDGLHLGHQAVLRVVKEQAEQAGLDSAVLFLRPNPLRLIAPEHCPPSLTTESQTLALLKDFGINLAAIGRFDERMRTTSAEAFLARLAEAFQARGIVTGTDVRFGYKGLGNVDTIRDGAARFGYETHLAEPAMDGGLPVSSTRAREAVRCGRLEEAARLLGRPYSMSGRVAKGDQRGRELGFPTANIDYGDLQLPPDGIYAAWAEADGQRHMSAASLGVRPTFDGKERKLEAHLLDFDGDLYGKEMEIAPVAKLRDELRFENVEALIEQMRVDVERAREILSKPRFSQ
ncbi:MAG: riboflavin biosynthesis protein RibF [Candidatus Poribacteria bacterium]|nr:riboflavin biosynthesis protein RibF [Candidatus Poribacteria bacterium]